MSHDQWAIDNFLTMQASFNNILSLLNHNCSSTPKSKITIRHGNMSYYLQCFIEKDFYFFIFDVLTPLSAIFQLYHGDQF